MTLRNIEKPASGINDRTGSRFSRFNFRKCRSVFCPLIVAGLIWLQSAFPSHAIASEPTFFISEDPMDTLALRQSELSIELRSDAGLFALYAAFNALGYDKGSHKIPGPFPRQGYAPLRQHLRDSLQLSKNLRRDFDNFLQQSTADLEAFEACALTLSSFLDANSAPSSKKFCSGSLRTLPTLLKRTWDEGSLNDKYDEAALASRNELKRTFELLASALPQLDTFLGAPVVKKSPSSSKLTAPDPLARKDSKILVLHVALSAQSQTILNLSPSLTAVTTGSASNNSTAEEGIFPAALAFSVLRQAAKSLSIHRNCSTTINEIQFSALAAAALRLSTDALTIIVSDERERKAVDRERKLFLAKKKSLCGKEASLHQR